MRITAVEEIPFLDWDEFTRRHYETDALYDQPHTYPHRPVRLRGTLDDVPDHPEVSGVTRGFWSSAAVLPEHYAVCRFCLCLYPCQDAHQDNTLFDIMNASTDALDVKVGHCHHCLKKITPRLKRIRVPGPNLINPSMPDGTVVFHGRSSCCAMAAKQYELHLLTPDQVDVPAPRKGCNGYEDCSVKAVSDQYAWLREPPARP